MSTHLERSNIGIFKKLDKATSLNDTDVCMAMSGPINGHLHLAPEIYIYIYIFL